MPTYDYRTTSPDTAPECCREPFEVVQRMAEDALTKCPKCGGPIERMISAPGFTTKKSTKAMMSDANLKRLGFKKMVNEGGGKFRDVLAD
jgi:putative FmdB family regulatory protein